MWTSLHSWGWLTFGCGLLFLACYAVLIRREWRKQTTATARWMFGLSSLGFISVTMGATFPVEKRIADVLVLAGALLCLIAYGVKWRSERAGARGGAGV